MYFNYDAHMFTLYILILHRIKKVMDTNLIHVVLKVKEIILLFFLNVYHSFTRNWIKFNAVWYITLFSSAWINISISFEMLPKYYPHKVTYYDYLWLSVNIDCGSYLIIYT